MSQPKPNPLFYTGYDVRADIYADDADKTSRHETVEIDLLTSALAAAHDENARLRAGMADAIECVESWAAYASDYFREKHDLSGDLDRLRAQHEPWRMMR